MDKSWILIGNRAVPEYLNGVEQFLNFAFSNLEVGARIQCPCVKCNNVLWKTRDEVKTDLYWKGINQTYIRWIYHGESDFSSDDETDISEDSNLENDDGNTFDTGHSVKVYHNATRRDVENRKGVPDLAKNRIDAHMPDKVKDIAEKTQEVEEGTDMDPIIDAASVQITREKSSYVFGQGSGIKPTSRISRKEIQEQLQAQAEEERRKLESVESKLMEIQTQLEDERKNREAMEARLMNDQKKFKESIIALISHMPHFKNDGLPASIFNIGINSTSSNETSPTSFMNVNELPRDLHERENQESEMQKELDNLKHKLSYEKQNLVAAYGCDYYRSLCDEKDAELQVLKKMEEDVKARNMLHTAEKTKKRLLEENASLGEKIIALKKKKSSEDKHA